MPLPDEQQSLSNDSGIQPGASKGPNGQDLSQAEGDLAAEKEKNKELYEKYIRSQAEFENYKKRMDREKCEYYKYALERLIKDLIPVLDHLELAIKSAGESKDFDKFTEGVILICKQLKDVLCKEGLADVCSTGERFDPSKHEAVMHMESEEHEPDMVMQEIKKGYYLNERLIRPAMVTVAKKPGDKQESPENS